MMNLIGIIMTVILMWLVYDTKVEDKTGKNLKVVLLIVLLTNVLEKVIMVL